MVKLYKMRGVSTRKKTEDQECQYSEKEITKFLYFYRVELVQCRAFVTTDQKHYQSQNKRRKPLQKKMIPNDRSGGK